MTHCKVVLSHELIKQRKTMYGNVISSNKHDEID